MHSLEYKNQILSSLWGNTSLFSTIYFYFSSSYTTNSIIIVIVYWQLLHHTAFCFDGQVFSSNARA